MSARAGTCLEYLVRQPSRYTTENRCLRPAGGWMPQDASEAMLADALHPQKIHPHQLLAPQDRPDVIKRLREAVKATQKGGRCLWDITPRQPQHTDNPLQPRRRRSTNTGDAATIPTLRIQTPRAPHRRTRPTPRRVTPRPKPAVGTFCGRHGSRASQCDTPCHRLHRASRNCLKSNTTITTHAQTAAAAPRPGKPPLPDGQPPNMGTHTTRPALGAPIAPNSNTNWAQLQYPQPHDRCHPLEATPVSAAHTPTRTRHAATTDTTILGCKPVNYHHRPPSPPPLAPSQRHQNRRMTKKTRLGPAATACHATRDPPPVLCTPHALPSTTAHPHHNKAKQQT